MLREIVQSVDKMAEYRIRGKYVLTAIIVWSVDIMADSRMSMNCFIVNLSTCQAAGLGMLSRGVKYVMQHKK